MIEEYKKRFHITETEIAMLKYEADEIISCSSDGIIKEREKKINIKLLQLIKNKYGNL